MQIATIISLTLIFLRAAFAAAASATIAGVLVDDKGAPIANASVLYASVQTITRLPNGHRVASGPTANASVKTLNDGSFSVSPDCRPPRSMSARTASRAVTSAPANGVQQRPAWTSFPAKQ